jgi:uncharacterized protein
MTSKLMTPGIYIDETNSFPSSAIAVETSVPVFIGYTSRAVSNGKSLPHLATRCNTLRQSKKATSEF